MGLPEPEVGDRLTTAGGREVARIVSVDPGKQLTDAIMDAFVSARISRSRSSTRSRNCSTSSAR
jgi:hypothetical protein